MSVTSLPPGANQLQVSRDTIKQMNNTADKIMDQQTQPRPASDQVPQATPQRVG